MPKTPEVFVVPSEEQFAIQLAKAFCKESDFDIQLEKNETELDVILSIPEIHGQFTLWLCNFVRESSFEDVKSPNDKMYN